MNDEFEELKRMFRQEEPPVPRPEAREAAIGVAMARFEQENLNSRQGSPLGVRLMRRVGAFTRNLKGTKSMPSIRLNQALLAGTSLAVLTLIVVNTGVLQGTWTDTLTFDTEAPAPLPSRRSEPQLKVNEADELQRRSSELKKESRSRQSADVTAKQQSGQVLAMKDAAAPPVASESVAAAGRAMVSPAPAPDPAQPYYRDQGRDKFSDITPNPVKITREEPVSTFSIDVDTASYSFMRAALNANAMPQKDAVRVEELINYFPYDYAGPADRAEPFKATATVFPTPWNADTRLLHIGIKGFALNGKEKPRANLVFLIDTSGSMNDPSKLPLLRNSMKLLAEALDPEDTISIVAYAGEAGTVLEPTKVRDKAKILAALDGLESGGSTAGAEGIRQAYRLAEQSFDPAGVNRVILATDGDFNVGITDPQELKSFIERKRAGGVYLSVLGFGRGNYNDELMQALAQNGNGNAAYIDTLSEARKMLAEEATSTLFPIATDVKIQVEFNPQAVAEYRLIGYETRLLNREDFNNDKVDAGDIGSGHTVTAIYEITPLGSKARLVDDLRYAAPPPETSAAGEYAFLKLRYKLPGGDTSKLIETPVTAANEVPDIAAVPSEARFAAAVAAFGQILRGGQYIGRYSLDDVIALAQGAKGQDPFGYRTEFINLARLAKSAQALEPINP